MSDILEIRPFDAPLGAAVMGIDLAQPLDKAAFERLAAAFAEHLVLVFPRQRITDEDLLAFSRHWGRLDRPGPSPSGRPPHPVHPELNVISNIVEEGEAIGSLGDAETVWHADLTYREPPPTAAVLYALEIPPVGGKTYFANMYAAYDALDEATKALIADKVAIHDAAHNSAGILRKGYENVTDVRQTPGARHGLVRTDPKTGRKGLFLGRRPWSYVVGMEVADSDALLDRLWSHATDPRFAIGHEWELGDVLMWSNLEVLHKRDAFDGRYRRRMHRTQISGKAA